MLFVNDSQRMYVYDCPQQLYNSKQKLFVYSTLRFKEISVQFNERYLNDTKKVENHVHRLCAEPYVGVTYLLCAIWYSESRF